MAKLRDEWCVTVFTRHTQFSHGGTSSSSTSLVVPGFTSQKLAEEAASKIRTDIVSFDVAKVTVIKVKDGNGK